MTSRIVSHELMLRLGLFFAVFAVLAVWEFLAARRDLTHGRPGRWLANLGLAATNALLVRLLFPAAGVGMALFVEAKSWGLLPLFPIPHAVSFVLAVVLLDLTIYLQHVLFHAIPALWRLHRVHHADQDFDVTTGIRFHPLEIAVSVGIQFAAIAALGPPPEAVFVFAALLNATAMFSHGNVRIPVRLDRGLRWLLVTPDMHRVHHSVVVSESNSNFGFNLPWWDRLFGTYQAQPRAGHAAMTLGVEDLLRAEPLGLVKLLRLPFKATASRQPIASRSEPFHPGSSPGKPSSPRRPSEEGDG